jgi:hypothetical protein
MPTSTESLTPARFGEVLPFAKKHGVDAYLYPVEKMTRRVFPDAARISLFIEDDPEIANDAHLVFEVFVSGLEPEQYVEAKWRWSQGLFEVCPAPLVSVFRCRLRVAEP